MPILFPPVNNKLVSFLIILNNDTEVDKAWLKEIAFAMQDQHVGAAQPKILIHGTSPAKIEYVGGSLDRLGYAHGIGHGEVDKNQYDNLEDIFYAAGTAMILRKKTLEEVGLFDEKFEMHWEDVDLSWRIRLNGQRTILIPKAIVYHKGSRTMSKFIKKESVAWHVRKNRIAGLIKNYGMLNLIIYLPMLLVSYFFVFLKETLVDRNIKLGLSSFRAIAWNISNFHFIFKQRKLVQEQIRHISDKNIVRLMK